MNTKLAQTLMMALLLTTSALASVLPCFANKKVQGFLKINAFYVLYTEPVVPYLSHNTFMVGLDGIAPMINVHVVPDPLHHTATLVINRHTLVFQAGSSVARIDGRKVPMDVPAVSYGKRHQLVVPLSVFQNVLPMQSEWDAAHHVMTINSQQLEGNPVFEEFVSLVGGEETDQGNPEMLERALFLVSVSLIKAPPGARAVEAILQTKIQNVTTHQVPAYKPAVNFMPYCEVFGNAGSGITGLPPNPPDMPYSDPAFAAKATKSYPTDLLKFNNQPVAFVVACIGP